LPLPEESALTGATPNELRRAASNFHQSWFYLLSAKDLFLHGEATAPSTGETLDGENLWWRLFLIVGAYYDFSIRLLLRANVAGKPGVHPLPGLGLSRLDEWVGKLNREDLEALQQDLALITQGRLAGEEAEQLTAKLVSALRITSIEEAHEAIIWEAYRNLAGFLAGTYLTGLFAAVFGELLRRTSLPLDLIEIMDGISHRTAAQVFAGPKEDGWPPQLIKLSQRLLGTIFEQWVRIYDEPDLDQIHRTGPFSSIRLSELAPLANRDARMMKKYGSKRIEQIFEQQLALIVQSFGLYVISTRTGERTVDLICISADPTVRFTFLLEAKTSGRPYALPRDDARALLEYIREVQAGLTTLPPLHFVLMVGPPPSLTLEKKLQALETEAGLPIRYCTAHELKEVRPFR
jgi:hypothetical protein